jgi:hypothetical protein
MTTIALTSKDPCAPIKRMMDRDDAGRKFAQQGSTRAYRGDVDRTYGKSKEQRDKRRNYERDRPHRGAACAGEPGLAMTQPQPHGECRRKNR